MRKRIVCNTFYQRTKSIHAFSEDGTLKLYTATAIMITSACLTSATKAEETESFAICSAVRLSAGVKFAPTQACIGQKVCQTKLHEYKVTYYDSSACLIDSRRRILSNITPCHNGTRKPFQEPLSKLGRGRIFPCRGGNEKDFRHRRFRLGLASARQKRNAF